MSNVASKETARVVLPDQALRPSANDRYSSEATDDPYGSTRAIGPIVIIDSHLLSRECLGRVLSKECEAQVACFSTIDEWLASGQAPTASLVVLCQCGRSAAESVKEVDRLSEVFEQGDRGPAVVLSDNEDPDLIVQMLGKSVRGYLPTSLPIAIAVQAIELARAGGVYVPASSLIASHRLPEAASAGRRSTGLFTVRQAAVVEALRRGKANKIIAYELKMRESTVKVHVRNIMKKLHATNRTEVAYMANRLFNGEELGELDRT